jgi:hypothetical protein
MQVKQCKAANFFAAVLPKEIDQSVGGGDIGSHCMRTPAPVMGQIVSPARRKRSSGMTFPV